MRLEAWFDRVVLISLGRRLPRLRQTRRLLQAAAWPFRPPEVFDAIDGWRVPVPEGWTSGPGAWGSLRSHQLVLERALLDGARSLLVIEDDLCLASGFRRQIRAFLDAVPEDWEQLMIGGQHNTTFGAPRLVRPGVYECVACERLHCYAIRGDYMREVYQAWTAAAKDGGEVHGDWVLARNPGIQRHHRVYAPQRFLAGQRAGKSDVTRLWQPRRFWQPPGTEAPLILLRASPAVAASLRQYGFYFGARLDSMGANAELTEILEDTDSSDELRLARIRQLITGMQWDASGDSGRISVIWHESVARELIEQASDWPVHEVRGQAFDDVLTQLERLRPEGVRQMSRGYVIHLSATRPVAEAMRTRGWHLGRRAESASGYNADLAELYRSATDPDERLRRLSKIIADLQDEAAAADSVAVVWHPGIAAREVRMSSPMQVVELSPATEREALDLWVKGRTAGQLRRLSNSRRTELAL